MKSKPYVGITGPVTTSEVLSIDDSFGYAGYNMDTPHMPMMGFLVSYKTLRGLRTANRRYPALEELPWMMRTSGAFNMIHYNSKEMPTLAHQVTQIFDSIPGLCNALQLNIVWPWPYQVNKIKEKFPDMKIVFQASTRVMKDISPREMAIGIKNYGDSLSYVLIDPSGGKGQPFDVENSLAVYSELKDKHPDLTIGFAGGFTGDNVAERLETIISRTGDTDFCIDAEGGLRDKVTDAYGDDLFNVRKVRAYLQSASSVLK